MKDKFIIHDVLIKTGDVNQYDLLYSNNTTERTEKPTSTTYEKAIYILSGEEVTYLKAIEDVKRS